MGNLSGPGSKPVTEATAYFAKDARRRHACMGAQRRESPLPAMCGVATVRVSGHRAWRSGGKPDRTLLNDPRAIGLMKSNHAVVRAAYGWGRMHRSFEAGATASV